MGRPAKSIKIEESIAELKQLQKRSLSHIRPRIQMLILIKTEKASSKQALGLALGMNCNTVQNWRQRYEKGGIKLLVADKRGGNRKPVINSATDAAIKIKLSDPIDAPRSFKELQQWVDEHYVPGIHYQTLNKFVKRKYKAKLKVARKSHIKKNEEACEAFKKNQ